MRKLTLMQDDVPSQTYTQEFQYYTQLCGWPFSVIHNK